MYIKIAITIEMMQWINLNEEYYQKSKENNYGTTKKNIGIVPIKIDLNNLSCNR